MMDGVKKLAQKLQEHSPEIKPLKRPHTISVNHESYVVLFSYCKRKGTNVGDVISDLMNILLEQLLLNGELTQGDQNVADDFDRVREDREESKDKTKKLSESA